MKNVVRAGLLAVMLILIVGCVNSLNSEQTTSSRDVKGSCQNNYVSTKVLKVKNASWEVCGQKKIDGFIAQVEMTGLKGQKLTPEDFTYIDPCSAEDDLGTKYQGGTTGITPNQKLAEQGSFILEARFTPPLNPKAKKITFSFKLEPRFKVKESNFNGLSIAKKDKQLEPGLVLEKVVQRPEFPTTEVIILQDSEDYKKRQFAESCYLITEDGQRHSLRSLGASDSLPNGKVRNTLGFEPVAAKESFVLVAAWQLPRENWQFSFRDIPINFEDQS